MGNVPLQQFRPWRTVKGFPLLALTPLPVVALFILPYSSNAAVTSVFTAAVAWGFFGALASAGIYSAYQAKRRSRKALLQKCWPHVRTPEDVALAATYYRCYDDESLPPRSDAEALLPYYQDYLLNLARIADAFEYPQHRAEGLALVAGLRERWSGPMLDHDMRAMNYTREADELRDLLIAPEPEETQPVVDTENIDER